MTWSFFFVAVLIVGVVLAAVIGGLRNDRHGRSQHRHLVLPHADHHGVFRSLFALRAAVGLSGFGLAGLLACSLLGLPPITCLAVAAAAGAVCTLAAFVVVRPGCAPARSRGRATAVREMLPGAYGQIRLEQGEHIVIMAAQSADDRPIRVGAEVEVLDCDRSVVRVRLVAAS